MKLKKTVARLMKAGKKLLFGSKQACITTGFGLVFLSVLITTSNREQPVKIVQTKHDSKFNNSRILGSRRSIYLKKEKVLAQKLKVVANENKNLKQDIFEIKKLIEELRRETNDEKDETSSQENTESISENMAKPVETEQTSARPLRLEQLSPQRSYRRSLPKKNPDVVSFPVKAKSRPGRDAVTLPAGSFVKAVLLTGVEAPEGKALPVLLQADYAFIGPNKTKIDLSGCFLIAKSTGNLSIERVEMQATKMSCVSKSGKMFEKNVNGFIADDKDNSFAVTGVLNSKQNRVAAMAFLSSIVEGIGKSIQQAQTSTATTGDGQSSTKVTGDQTRYIVAGGAANAGSMVASWYLKQAQSLLPTINVGSGRSVWLVMQDTVSLPNWYFKRVHQRSGSNIYSYLTRFTN